MDSEKIFWIAAVAIAAGLFLFFAFGSLVAPVNATQQQDGYQQAAAPTGGQLASVKGGVQEISLSVQGANYMPNPIRVKKGVPVRLIADLNSVAGCSRSIVIPEFGIRKVVGAGDNIIEFTPDKSGTFDIACSMNMYRGKIIVEEADGSVAASAAPANAAAPAAAATCGAGGKGGCGCGGLA